MDKILDILEVLKSKYKVEQLRILDIEKMLKRPEGDYTEYAIYTATYKIYTRYQYGNGDEFLLWLIKKDGEWELTDYNEIATTMLIENLNVHIYEEALTLIKLFFNIYYIPKGEDKGFYATDITEDNVLQKIESLVNVYEMLTGLIDVSDNNGAQNG
ncbi:MAG: hypothetical protein ABFD00_03820 [Chloroherpetonaceae bacterium]